MRLILEIFRHTFLCVMQVGRVPNLVILGVTQWAL